MPHVSRLLFDLANAIEMLRDAVQRFAPAEIAPHVADIDRHNAFRREQYAEGA